MKSIIFLFSFTFFFLSIQTMEAQNETLINLLVDSKEFYTEGRAKYVFNEDRSFIIDHESLTEPIKGVFELETITLNKKDIKGVNEEGTVSFSALNFIIGPKKAVWILSTKDCYVQDGFLYLYFYDLDEGFNVPPTALVHHIQAPKIDWSEMIGGSRFLKSVDFISKSWITLIIEDAIEKPNQEEALEFAMEKILDFPDEERKQYAEILKEVIREKYSQKK